MFYLCKNMDITNQIYINDKQKRHPVATVAGTVFSFPVIALKINSLCKHRAYLRTRGERLAWHQKNYVSLRTDIITNKYASNFGNNANI
jgi:hypothetical protein